MPSSADIGDDTGWEDIGRPIDLDRLLSAARRQWHVVAIATLAFLGLGLFYLLIATPNYTASTRILIDRGSGEIVSQLTDIAVASGDEASVLSEIELFKSDAIALAVADRLKLGDEPGFLPPTRSFLAKLKEMFDTTPSQPDRLAEDEATRRRLVADEIMQAMSITRAGRSYALSISYTSRSPQLSAAISDAIAEAYLVDKMNSKYEATRRATDWLQTRMDELKKQALDADLAVQKFRADNGLTQAGGRLLSEQQLSELNTALTAAQSETGKARTKYQNARTIVETGDVNAIVSDTLANPVSSELRQKYLDASKLEADISRRLGKEHAQAIRLRGEMREYQRLMSEELGRMTESYRSEYDIAKSREAALSERLSQATAAAVPAGQALAQLRELERSAETYRNLLQNFSARFQEARQRQSLPMTDARIITRAQVPLRPSAPKKLLVLALSLLAGIAFGSGLAAYREFRDRFFRTGEEIGEALSLPYLGHVPFVAPLDLIPVLPGPHPLRLLQTSSAIAQYVVDHPLSAFSETIRNVKIAADIEGSKVIGMISSLPGEGKSTIAINFAELLAMQGARVLLIDADLRNPGATWAIARHADQGIVEALLQEKPIASLLMLDARTRLAFLPAVIRHGVPHSSDLLGSPQMAALLLEMRRHFDYIIVDLPPLGPVVDARAIGPLMDASLAVVEWGRTSRRVARSTFQGQPDLMRKCIGAVLNKVDTAKVKLYRPQEAGEDDQGRYTSYYQEA